MVKVLLTRPYEDSLLTSKKLKKLYIDSDIAPFIQISKYKNSIENCNNDFDLLIFTSKNSVRFFNSELFKDIKTFSVGNGTFNELKKKKFTNVFDANGDVYAIIELFKKHFFNKKLNILHPTTTDVKIELKKFFKEQGSQYNIFPVYSVKQKNCEPQIFKNFFCSNHKYILVFSPKTSESIKSSIKLMKLEKFCQKKRMIVLSQSVKEPIANINFEKIFVADKPNEESLIKKLLLILASEGEYE